MENYGIYVHIPFCKARCNYCAFCSCTDFQLCQKYFEKLFSEIQANKDTTQQISTVYVGGGTPSSMPESYLNALFDNLKSCFDLSHVKEITVECNPESATEQMLTCLHSNGVNRLSFGLQSANDQTLSKIGRLHDYDTFCKAISRAKSLGFDNLNADVIIGLPESKEDFCHTLDEICRLPLTHVSCYALEIHKGTTMYRQTKGKNYFDDDTLSDMYDCAHEKLCSNGFHCYEVSNFAKDNGRCLHNLNYWRAGKYYGFGASAFGYVGNVRYHNPMNVQDYVNKDTDKLHVVDETLSQVDCAKEYVMLGLRLRDGIDTDYLLTAYGVDFWQLCPKAKWLVENNLLCTNGSTVYVPQDKTYVLNSILCELL